MARPRELFPKPRCHKGAAVVDVYGNGNRRMQTLGPWGSEKASIEYERVLARLRAGKSAVVPPEGVAPTADVPADLTVAEAHERYNDHIERYYVNPDDTPTGTANDIKITIGYVRRLKDATFRARVAELRAAMTARALGRLTDGMTKASDALNKLVSHRDPDVRHKAAVKVIELALKVRDQSELEDRLERVEQLLAGGADDASDGNEDQESGDTRPASDKPPGAAA